MLHPLCSSVDAMLLKTYLIISLPTVSPRFSHLELTLFPPPCSPPNPRYYPVDVLNGLISSLGMTLTAVADIMRPEHRAASTAFITAMFSIALIIGPIIGGYLQPVTAGACVGVSVSSLSSGF